MEEYCKWRPALDVLVLEIDAFHLWYVEPGDVKKALDGGEIMCGALSMLEVSPCVLMWSAWLFHGCKKSMPLDRTSGCRVLMFVGRPSGWGLLPAGGLVGPDLVARLREGTDEDQHVGPGPC